MPAPASETQAPMVLAPAPVPGQDMEPAPSPAPVMEPVPQQLSPAKLAAGAQAWQKMVSALNQFATVAPIYAKAIADAGENIGPGAKQAFEDWAAKADGLKLRVKEIIENTPQLQQAIDAVGGAAAQPQGEDVAGLAAYFGFLASYSSEAVSLLATPLPTGFNGLGNPALMWAERLAGPAWRGLMQVLGSRTVATVGATAVAANSLEDALTGETEEYLESNRHLAEMVAEGKLTADQAVQLKEKPSSSNGALVVGAVALGALGVWYLSRSKA